MKSLREFLPQLEIDWLLPLWLLVAILAAAVAETVAIGLGVERVYGLYTGWVVGVVIASAQAMGSMMWARASTHNAKRKTPYKDKSKNEPKLNVMLPLLVSVLAGVVSAWVSWYLYDSTDVPGLGHALAIASPAGSIAAALLNGTFAYGEASVSAWHEERKERKTRRNASQADAGPTQADANAMQANASAMQADANVCWCGYPLRNYHARGGHARKHLREVASANDAASARATLEELYPGRDVPGVAEVAAMRRRIQEKES